MNKLFFERVVKATGSGDLAVFSKAWPGTTVFNLKQIAGTLYPSEQERAHTHAQARAHTLGFAGLALISGLYVLLDWKYFQWGWGWVFMLDFFFWGWYWSNPEGSTNKGACDQVKRSLAERFVRSGVSGTYIGELERFAEAIERVTQLFSLSLDDLIHMSRPEALAKASASLTAIVQKLADAEAGLRSCEAEGEEASGYFAEHIRVTSDLKLELKFVYDTLSSLGLARGGYGPLFLNVQALN